MNGKDQSDSETGLLPNINLSCHMLMQLGSGASYGVNMSVPTISGVRGHRREHVRILGTL